MKELVLLLLGLDLIDHVDIWIEIQLILYYTTSNFFKVQPFRPTPVRPDVNFVMWVWPKKKRRSSSEEVYLWRRSFSMSGKETKIIFPSMTFQLSWRRGWSKEDGVIGFQKTSLSVSLDSLSLRYIYCSFNLDFMFREWRQELPNYGGGPLKISRVDEEQGELCTEFIFLHWQGRKWRHLRPRIEVRII